MLKLISRLCRVSADMFWSKIVRERGGARLLVGRWELNEERRKSELLRVRLVGRRAPGTGENDLCPRRDAGRERD